MTLQWGVENSSLWGRVGRGTLQGSVAEGTLPSSVGVPFRGGDMGTWRESRLHQSLTKNKCAKQGRCTLSPTMKW